jgi:hypothetical protein
MKYLFILILSFCVTAYGANITAGTAGEVISAFNSIRAGDTLTIAPGEYYVGTNLTVANSGTENAYIVIRALQKGTATLRASSGDQMVLINKRYLVFENLTFNGGLCAHCVHIQSGAGHLIFRNCIMYGTNDKAVKNSALTNAAVDDPGWQDYQLYENCEGYGGNSVASGMLNINGPDYLTVRGCYIHDYSGSAYFAAFIKAGGANAIFENNLVKNVKVGISFGGGLTGAQWHRRGEIEALNGIARNNVVVNASDKGLHCNKAQMCRFLNNTLVNTTGIQNQNSSVSIQAINNIIMGGSIGSGIYQMKNYTGANDPSWFWGAASDNFRLKASATQAVGQGVYLQGLCDFDFLGKARPNPPSLGAYEVYSSADEMPAMIEKQKDRFNAPRMAVMPNPVNRMAVINVKLKEPLPLMDLTVVDVNGRVVYNLHYDKKRAGYYKFLWNGRDHENRPVPSGQYFVRLSMGMDQVIKPFTIIR